MFRLFEPNFELIVKWLLTTHTYANKTMIIRFYAFSCSAILEDYTRLNIPDRCDSKTFHVVPTSWKHVETLVPLYDSSGSYGNSILDSVFFSVDLHKLKIIV